MLPKFKITSLLLILLFAHQLNGQTKQIYDPELNLLITKQVITEKERTLRYTPDGEDFVIINGKNKFNRALYGTNTGFRIETGDVPEFALYLPRMGGNLSFKISNKKTTKALNDANQIECRYRPGSRIYNISDSILGKGKVIITALAMSGAEGLILKIETINLQRDTKLSWRFGGCADKRFSREGDLGVDAPDSFDFKAEYCKNNEFSTTKNSFQVLFGAKKDKHLTGIFPPKSTISIANEFPYINGKMKFSGTNTYYIALQIPTDEKPISYNQLPDIFTKAESARKQLASRIKIVTPDPYFNTLGGTLAVAADGIWSGETWLHGAVGWRMPLSGWRAAYTGDALGWHDRAKTHFNAYAASQVTNVAPTRSHPTQDSALNLARAEKSWGTQMYSNGYICRNPIRNDQMHHYDMNLCYIDELLWHFNWTGDLDYARKMWPVITKSLAWEKRNFDPDNDGLYDAYCCIWASDALYYNSGAVTHSTAYNYRANKLAAEIASKIGENSTPYEQEATKIHKALNARLWISSKGHWAEFQDFMGEKKLHESPAVWTIYHAIDSDIHDAFQGYQATRYIDTEIPHIPVIAKGLEENNYATISTSNWLPYSWSINNVAFAEVMNTALAYWETGRNEAGFKLLKSSVLDGMYIGASPGNIGQISYYDAARGECYRDFGDPIGVMSRTLVQGLFGIIPDAMNNKLVLRPGFPTEWNYASIETPDIQFKFNRTEKKDIYQIKQSFEKKLTTNLQIRATHQQIQSITINGKAAKWNLIEPSIEFPLLNIEIPAEEIVLVEINWNGGKIEHQLTEIKIKQNDHLEYKTEARILSIFDPQQITRQPIINEHSIKTKVTSNGKFHTFFVEITQGTMKWWQPINVEISPKKSEFSAPYIPIQDGKLEMIELGTYFNDSVTNIFKNSYLSPRSPYTTLQIPTQGIGEWCHPKTTAVIDDSGLRQLAAKNNDIVNTKLNVSFKTASTGKNIAFTSRWDNFPRKIEIPVSGYVRKASLLLAGTSNHMQTHFVNGLIVAQYMDGKSDTLKLINPENWCPIEQDYFVDGLAFKLNAARPYRMHLKTGLVSNQLEKELNIKGVYGREIDGGAALILDMMLDNTKQLQKISIETIANDVIIGVMAITLVK